METHPKIRLDILIEAPMRKRLSALLDDHGVSGYTFFSALGGKGETAPWSRAGLVNDVGQMLLVVCVLDAEKRVDVLAALSDQLADHIGYVTAIEVEVMRPTKFP